jgi:hypothetical protein
LENPRSLKAGVKRIAQALHLTLSCATLKRLLKAAGYVWKRVRRSLRDKRNEEDFRAAQAHLAKLRKTCANAAHDFDLAYFDEVGFTLEPCVPYAWQPVGETLEVPSAHSPRLNVLGFLNLRGAFFSLLVEGSVDADVARRALDAYCAQMEKPTLLVLDNAPAHSSAAFQAEIPRWEAEGLYLLFLPPYCPELNLIELLWRKLKYEWLPLSAYASFKELTDSLLEVLKGVGSKYRITFA